MSNAKEKFKLICSSYLFLIKDNKILLGLRQNTGYMDGFYSMPAGHKEEGESVIDCLIREIKEEIGIDIDPKKARFVHVMHRKKEDERADFFFEVKEYGGDLQNMEPEKCAELKWFNIDSLPQNTIPYIKQAIECYQQGNFYSQFGWEEQ